MNQGNGRAIQRRTSRAIESHLQTVGWMSRQKISQLPAEGEVFLLTSPFIELPISECDGPVDWVLVPLSLLTVPVPRLARYFSRCSLTPQARGTVSNWAGRAVPLCSLGPRLSFPAQLEMECSATLRGSPNDAFLAASRMSFGLRTIILSTRCSRCSRAGSFDSTACLPSSFARCRLRNPRIYSTLLSVFLASLRDLGFLELWTFTDFCERSENSVLEPQMRRLKYL